MTARKSQVHRSPQKLGLAAPFMPRDLTEISELSLLEIADSRAADPLVTELAARLENALDALQEVALIRARHAQAKATLELLVHRFGAPPDVVVALKKMLTL